MKPNKLFDYPAKYRLYAEDVFELDYITGVYRAAWMWFGNTENMQERYVLCTCPPSLLFIVQLGFDNDLGDSHRDGCSFTGQQCFEHDVSERAHLTRESSANDRRDIVRRQVTVFGGSGGGGGGLGVYIWWNETNTCTSTHITPFLFFFIQAR